MALVEVSGTVVAGDLPLLTRDELTSMDFSNAVRFIFDVPFSSGVTLPSPVVDYSTVEDLSENENSVFRVGDGGAAPVITGGGIDFSTVDKRDTRIEIPAAVAKAIYDNAQQYLVVLYLKLPASVDWNPAVQDLPIISWAAASTGYVATTELMTIGLSTQAATKQIFMRRQTAINAQDYVAISTNSLENFAGKVVQIAAWRTAAEQKFRIKSADGMLFSSVLGTGANNSQNFSPLVGKIGIPLAFWSTSFTAAQLNARKFRLYRGFIEAIAVSGRSPIEVADADWARVAARADFS